MTLFGMRVRPKHKILVNIDLAIQECQKAINESEKGLKESVAYDQSEFGGTGVTKGGTASSHYSNLVNSFEKLKKRLLKDIKDIDNEIDKWKGYRIIHEWKQATKSH